MKPGATSTPSSDAGRSPMPKKRRPPRATPGPERVARRQAARPRLLGREREPAAVRVADRELRLGERDVAVGRQPARELVARLELDPLARAWADADLGRALVADPHRLAVEVEPPERGREVPALEQARARAELLAHRARQRRHRRRREHAAHVVRMKAVAVVHVDVELRVRPIGGRDDQARLGAELVRGADAAGGRGRVGRRSAGCRRRTRSDRRGRRRRAAASGSGVISSLT